MTLTPAGNLGIGTPNPSEMLAVVGDNADLVLRTKSNTDRSNLIFRYARDNAGSPEAAQNGDVLGGVNFTGYDGASYLQAARIVANADANYNVGNAPGKLRFEVNDGTNFNDAMTILSDGNVGIGTNTPTNPLHIQADVFELLHLERSSNFGSVMQFSNSGATTWNAGMSSAGAYGVFIDGGSFGEEFLIDANGNVGIGQTTPLHTLHVESAGTDITGASYYQFTNSLTPVTGPLTTPSNIDIYCSGNMAATSFLALSDRRIKTDLEQSDRQADLSRLMQLKVTDYTHIDTVKKGSQRVKGFIAQEVKDVYPEAVRQKERFIPNVYSLCEMGDLDNENWTITLPEAADMTDIAIDQKLKLILPDGKAEVEIVAMDGHTLTVRGKRPADLDQVFVYGTWVDDFHVIDYDKLYTLGVSSIQQLYADLQAEQQRNDQQQQQIDSLNSIVKELKVTQTTAASAGDNAEAVRQLQAQVESLTALVKQLQATMDYKAELDAPNKLDAEGREE